MTMTKEEYSVDIDVDVSLAEMLLEVKVDTAICGHHSVPTVVRIRCYFTVTGEVMAKIYDKDRRENSVRAYDLYRVITERKEGEK